MKKKVLSILTIVLALVLTVALFACSTSASWANQKSETKSSGGKIKEMNGSEKYIVFAALDSAGQLLATGSASATAAYAVVGYTGLVAELVVPDTYDEKPVTKILACEPYSAYKCYMNGAAYAGEEANLQNKTTVTSIVFGANVVYVGAGVCAGMTSLTSVHFNHAQAGVTIGASAFEMCPLLTSQNITYEEAEEEGSEG